MTKSPTESVVEWLNQHRRDLCSLDRDSVLNQVRSALDYLLPESNVEVSKDSGITEIVISSRGVPSLTGEMERASAGLVASPTWRVLMPAPPRGFEFKFSRGDIRVDVVQSVFEPLKSDGSAAIGIGVSGLERLSREDALTVMRAGIGDRLFSLVDFWDFDWPRADEALPICDLAEFINWADSKRTHA